MNIKQFTSWLGSKLAVERVVAFLTPLVFAPAATFIAAYVASHFPGLPHPSAGELEGLEIAAFIGACGIAYKWLHGRQLATGPSLLAATGDGFHPITANPSGAEILPADLERLVDEQLTRRLSVLTQVQAS